MTHKPTSLFRTLLKSLLLPGILAMGIGVVIVHNLVKEEYDELQDSSLLGKANLLLTIFERSQDSGSPQLRSGIDTLMAFEEQLVEVDERTQYWFTDRAGKIIAQSRGATSAILPATPENGFTTANGHRYAVVTADPATVIVATPMVERNEAIRDVIFGTVAGFVMLSLFFAGTAYRAARNSAGVIARLSANIAQKDEHNLTPIDRQNAFTEIEPAIDTLDTLMTRLDAALSAERAFATNAAHELRTPVAISLAHVQRLKARLADHALAGSAVEIELGLKRLIRLIERLLQMSRAQSGLGVNTVRADITPVIRLMLKELRDREPDEAKLEIIPPTVQWQSRVDPDAMGIILSNLFDNALKYASGKVPVVVDAGTPGQIIISNDCYPLSSADLAAISARYVRKTPVSEGFGLGLSIVQELCNQSGCSVDIFSPCEGAARGFTAKLTIPEEPAT
ncbi:sensor histidine kinase [Sulfitobacter sp.]|uniref:sensor histidine kinase n=1 Tax=Sulfitobacter sp. TaxID=1903071 RepID=UPI0030039172